MNSRTTKSALIGFGRRQVFIALAVFALLGASNAPVAFASAGSPASVIARKPRVSADELEREIAARLMRVPELKMIRTEAEKLGVRVYLFGGTAAGFAHYVKWDLQRERGDKSYQPDRFDYDFTNIYRSTQDLDIVVDGSADKAETLRKALITKFPSFQGNKDQWEVRLLREKLGDKEALLENPDFSNQHTDSNSTGLIEVTKSPNEPTVRDLRDWNSKDPFFLRDVTEGKIHYYFSPDHETTSRAKQGLNPPIVSVVRFLTKAFQYELTIRPEDEATIKSIIDAFDPAEAQRNSYVARWMEKNGPKLVRHAVNIEYAWNEMERLGLRSNLIAMSEPARLDTMGWWLSKEPLRSWPAGRGSGKTAKELGIEIVAHETNSFLAYESITRSHSGAPNVFISRQSSVGEAAAYGDGFYTALGRKGMRGTGLTIRFHVDPNAKEGTDFIRDSSGQIAIFKNKRALRVIPEDLKFDLLGYLRMVGTLDASDRGVLEKLRRRVNNRIHALDANEIQEARELVRTHRVPDHRDPLLGEWLKLHLALENVDILEELVRQGYHVNQIVEEFMAVHDDARLRSLVDLVISRDDKAATPSLLTKVLSREFWKKDPAFHQQLTRIVRNSALTEAATKPYLAGVRPGVDDELMEKIFKTTKSPIDFLKAVGKKEWLERPIFGKILESVIMEPQVAAYDVDGWLKSVSDPEVRSEVRLALEKFLRTSQSFERMRSCWEIYVDQFGSENKSRVSEIAGSILTKFSTMAPEVRMATLTWENRSGSFVIDLVKAEGRTRDRAEIVHTLRAISRMKSMGWANELATINLPVDRVREAQLRALRLSNPSVVPNEYDFLRQEWFSNVSSPLLHELLNPEIARVYLESLSEPWPRHHASAATLRNNLAVALSATTLVLQPETRKLLKSILDSAKSTYEIRDAQELVELFDRTPFDYDKYVEHLKEIGSSVYAEHAFLAFAGTSAFDFDRYIHAFNKLKAKDPFLAEARLGFLTKMLLGTPKFDLKRHAVLVARFKDVQEVPESWLESLYSYLLRNDIQKRDPSFARAVTNVILQSRVRQDLVVLDLILALRKIEGGATPSQRALFEETKALIEKQGISFEKVMLSRFGVMYQNPNTEILTALDFYLNHVASDEIRTRLFHEIASSSEKSMAYSMAPLFRRWSGLQAWLTSAEVTAEASKIEQRREAIESSLSILRGGAARSVTKNPVIDQLMSSIEQIVKADRAAGRATAQTASPRPNALRARLQKAALSCEAIFR